VCSTVVKTHSLSYGNKMLEGEKQVCMWCLLFRAVQNIKVLLEDKDVSRMKISVSFALQSVSEESNDTLQSSF